MRERSHKLASTNILDTRWRCVGETFNLAGFWVPSDVLKPDQKRFMNTELHVENLPLQDFNGTLHDAYTQAIPGRLLASLKAAPPSPALTARTGSLKRLVLHSPRLQSLHYEDRGQGTSFTFSHGERVPAISSLRLRSYNWNHTREEVRRHWDFSYLQSLELISMPTFNFLRSVSFDDFIDLHTLRVEDYSAHLPDMREEATGGLYLLIKNHIRALEVLDVTCHTQIFPVDAIVRHSHSLQVLRFRDHIGFCEDDRRCPTLWPNDISLLAQHMRHVHTLEVDMDVRLCDPAEFLRAVCQFPALHTLTINVQTLIRAFEAIPRGIDRDYNATMQTFNFLVQFKRQTTPKLSWKRITVNIGGWKPIMVRRLGSAWQEHNANGLFAERCFILEQDFRGILTVHEEVALETPSRRNTPDLGTHENF